MAQDYDKIFKENFEELIKSLAYKILDINPELMVEIPDDLQYTIEKKPDFLKQVFPRPPKKRYILHIEVQSTDPATMRFRMLIYQAFLLHVYKIEVKQYVLYIGNKKKPNMPSFIEYDNLLYTFELINILDVNHEAFLYSDRPEDAVVAVLCNFNGKKPTQVITAIVQRLQTLVKNELILGKFLNQLEILSKLRNLQGETVKIINKMAVYYDLETDIRYLQGVGVGEVKGLEIGLEKGLVEGLEKGILGVKRASPNSTNQQIAKWMNVPVSLVDAILAKGES